MASRNEVVYQLAQEWLVWLNSRRFLGQPLQKNILVMLAEKNKTKKGPPDGPMSAEMAAFNLAVNALTDAGHLVPFITVYCDFRMKPIKTLAGELGIGRDTFYERAHETAQSLYRKTQELVVLNAQMKREIEEYVD